MIRVKIKINTHYNKSYCSHALYDETGKTWEFKIIIDSMERKDCPEEFDTTTIKPSLVWDMLPEYVNQLDSVRDRDPAEMGAMQEKIDNLQQELDSLKEAYQQIDGYWKESSKKASELSLWKSAHSGNYRNARRKKKYSSVDQGESIYKMHDKENVSFRKIAAILRMSYSSARRLYQEYL